MKSRKEVLSMLTIFLILSAISLSIWPLESVGATVEPKLWHQPPIPISGKGLKPGYYDRYGPYGPGEIAISISVTWTPTNQVLGIQIGTDPWAIPWPPHWFTGGSAGWSPSTNTSKSYYVWILASGGNTQPIDYSGTITLWFT